MFLVYRVQLDGFYSVYSSVVPGWISTPAGNAPWGTFINTLVGGGLENLSVGASKLF